MSLELRQAPLGGPASSALHEPDLDVYLTGDERAAAKILASHVARMAPRHLARRFKRLAEQFPDRPQRTWDMKEWLVTLPEKRLRHYAELSAFEAALLATPPARDYLSNWQAAAALAESYPGRFPAPTDQIARDLIALRAAARDRLRAKNRSQAPITVPEPAHPAAPRRGRRTATRPITTLSSALQS
ncbi:hypothetical protein ACFYPT_38825 [Streptomyces sp. NPDC005529]|uniref:hypothetical protein n=1 Tax=unclassified Streptomyces TaxID=2593676 RepID=UPI0033BCE821